MTTQNRNSINIQQCHKIFSISFLFFIILFFKKPDTFFNPQLWAEDGSVFLVDQINAQGFIIFKVYAGYILLLPRLCSLLADVINIHLEYIPLFYNFFAFLILLLVFLSIAFNTLEIPQGCKYAMAFSIILIPHSGEVFLNITNIQWILTLSVIIILSQSIPLSILKLSLWSLWLSFISLTGPLMVTLLPFLSLKVVYHWFISKNLSLIHKFILLVPIVSSMAQLNTIILNPKQLYSSENISNPYAYDSPLISFNKAVFRIFFSQPINSYADKILQEKSIFSSISISIISIILIFSIVILVLISKRTIDKQTFSISILFLFLAFVFTILGCYRTLSVYGMSVSWFFNDNFFFKTRYTYVPLVLFSWSLLLMRLSGSKLVSMISTVLLTLIFMSSVSNFTAVTKNCNWQYYVHEYKASRVSEIPIPPDCGVVWKVKPAAVYK